MAMIREGNWRGMLERLRFPAVESRVKDANGFLIIHHALKQGAGEQVVLALLRENPDSARAMTSSCCLPLHFALRYKASDEIIFNLLGAYPKGASIRNQFGWLPIHLALRYSFRPAVVFRLLDIYSEGAGEQDKRGWLPLHFALRYDAELGVAMRLLDAFPRGDKTPNGIGSLPLHFALRHHSAPELILRLLESNPQGARTRADDEWLRLYLGRSRVDTAENGARPIGEGTRTRPNRGWLPLHLAFLFNAETAVIMRILEVYPQAAGKRDESGWLPLHLSLRDKAWETISLRLLAIQPRGAAAQNDGVLPIHLAVLFGASPAVLSRLMEIYPQAAHTGLPSGQTAISIAARKGDKQILRLLLAAVTRCNPPAGVFSNAIAAAIEEEKEDAALFICKALGKEAVVGAEENLDRGQAIRLLQWLASALKKSEQTNARLVRYIPAWAAAAGPRMQTWLQSDAVTGEDASSGGG